MQTLHPRLQGATNLTAPFAEMALWLIDLQVARNDLDLSCLSESEHQRARRFRFERDALRYRTAHAALRALLAEASGQHPATLDFATGPQGKPRLAGHPGLHFNLSDSGDRALIGLSRGGPIGVDLECLAPLDDAAQLARANFSPSEQAAFFALTEAERLPGFYRCWTRKEACLKALGSGLLIEPHLFEAGLVAQPRHTHIPVDGQACSMTVSDVDLPPALRPALAAAVARLADPFDPLAM